MTAIYHSYGQVHHIILSRTLEASPCRCRATTVRAMIWTIVVLYHRRLMRAVHTARQPVFSQGIPGDSTSHAPVPTFITRLWQSRRPLNVPLRLHKRVTFRPCGKETGTTRLMDRSMVRMVTGPWLATWTDRLRQTRLIPSI